MSSSLCLDLPGDLLDADDHELGRLERREPDDDVDHAEVSLKDFRKDLIIEVLNEAGQVAIAYKVFRCWVSEYQALPDLDANANAVAIQHIKLENEGWERDYGVTEPSEPTFTEPAS